MTINDTKLYNDVKPYLQYRASDLICIDKETDERIFETILNHTLDEVIETPADIIISNTIPIKDLEIEVDESKGGYGSVRYRVVIFESLPKLENMIGNIEIGYLIVFYQNKPCQIVSLEVREGIDYIAANRCWSMANIPIIANIFTNTWYALEVMLLHPKIQTIYEKPQMIPIHNKTGARTQGKRKVKYIKKYYVKISDVEKITHTNEKDRKRKCLIWYVVGHWRKYKTGKTIFIQGYWKGELRAIKQNLTERERVVI